MSHTPIENTELFKRMRALANEAWFRVREWSSFAQSTVGGQLVRALDSVCANLAEGDGRYSDAEALHFFSIARGSLRESGYWLSVACDRELLADSDRVRMLGEVDELRQMLNGLIAYRRKTKNHNMVREAEAPYGSILEAGPDASRPTPHAYSTEDVSL